MQYMKIHNFRDYWKLEKGEMPEDDFVNERLTVNELKQVREVIGKMQEKGMPSTRIINALQKINKKLLLKWRAERAYWTEVKRDDTKLVANAGDELEIKSYRVVLSPHACDTCLDKTNNGKKIFKSSEFEKTGYGHVPPFHPNCYCIVLPE